MIEHCGRAWTYGALLCALSCVARGEQAPPRGKPSNDEAAEPQGGESSGGKSGSPSAGSSSSGSSPILAPDEPDAGAGGVTSGGQSAGFAGRAGSTGSGGGGTGGISALGCTPGATLLGAPINDAEDLNAQGHDYVQTTSSGWFVYYDEVSAGTVVPSKANPAQGILPGNGGNVFRGVGSGLAAGFWGAGFGLWVNPCIDTNGTSGVKFWLQNDLPVVIELMTPATTAIAGGGTCAADCRGNSAAPLPPSPNGGPVMLPYSAFSGGSAPFDPKRLTGIIFTVNAPGGAPWNFDISVDDFGLY